MVGSTRDNLGRSFFVFARPKIVEIIYRMHYSSVPSIRGFVTFGQGGLF